MKEIFYNLIKKHKEFIEQKIKEIQK